MGGGPKISPRLSRASPRCPRLSRLASRVSPHPCLSSFSPPCFAPLAHFCSFLLISARLLICSFRAFRASPVTRASRPASPAMENRQRKTVFMTTVPGVSNIAKITFFSLQPLSWRHCRNHFLSIVSQTPLDACPAPRHAMLGGCGPSPGRSSETLSPPSRVPPRRHPEARPPASRPSLPSWPAFRHPDIMTFWHSDTLTL